MKMPLLLPIIITITAVTRVYAPASISCRTSVTNVGRGSRGGGSSQGSHSWNGECLNTKDTHQEDVACLKIKYTGFLGNKMYFKSCAYVAQCKELNVYNDTCVHFLKLDGYKVASTIRKQNWHFKKWWNEIDDDDDTFYKLDESYRYRNILICCCYTEMCNDGQAGLNPSLLLALGMLSIHKIFVQL